MQKMADGEVETNDWAVYCDAQQTSFAREHLIEASIRRLKCTCRIIRIWLLAALLHRFDGIG